MARGEYLGSGYTLEAFKDPADILEDFLNVTDGVEFDTLVGMGLSGALVIPTLARALDKNFFIVRKKGTKCHSRSIGEGHVGERWIFVDDFVDSGKTRRQVQKAMAKVEESVKTTYVGTYSCNVGSRDEDFELAACENRWYNYETDEREEIPCTWEGMVTNGQVLQSQEHEASHRDDSDRS